MAEFPYVNEFHLYREFPEFYDTPFWYDLETGYLITRTIDRKYILEVRESDGDLVSMLQNAYDIAYTEVVNEPPTLDFKLPSDDDKVAGLARPNEIWLRNYDTQALIEKVLIGVRQEERT